MSFFSTLSKAAPTLARAGQIGTAGQVFANSGLVGLAGSAVMQYIQNRNRAEQNQVQSQAQAQPENQTAQEQAPRRPIAVEEELKRPEDASLIYGQSLQPVQLRQRPQNDSNLMVGTSRTLINQNVLQYVRQINELYDIGSIGDRLSGRIREIAPPVRSLAVQIMRHILKRESAIFETQNQAAFEAMLEVIINEVICGDVPLASLTIGAIRKKIADYVDNRRFGKDANEIQIWADVSAFIKEPHKNLSRYNQYQLYSYESLSNPRMSASLHIFNGASTMQILTLRTANFLISEHLDQFRQAFVHFLTQMGDPLVFMHEGDRDLPFVIFSWGLALAMAGDYDSFTNLTDMLLDGGQDLDNRFNLYMASQGYFYQNERGAVEPGQGLIMSQGNEPASTVFQQQVSSPDLSPEQEYRLERLDQLEIMPAFLPFIDDSTMNIEQDNASIVIDFSKLALKRIGSDPQGRRNQSFFQKKEQVASEQANPTLPLKQQKEVSKRKRRTRTKTERPTQKETITQSTIEQVIIDHIGRQMQQLGYDGRQGSTDRNFIQQAIVPPENIDDLSMIDRTIIAFKRYLVQRGLREKLKSLVLLGKIIHNLGRALSLLQHYLNFVNPMISAIIGSIIPSMERAGQVLQNEEQNESIIQQTQEEEEKTFDIEELANYVNLEGDEEPESQWSSNSLYINLMGWLSVMGQRLARRQEPEQLNYLPSGASGASGASGESLITTPQRENIDRLDPQTSANLENIAAQRRAPIRRQRLKLLAAGLVIGGGGSQAIGNERLLKIYDYLTGNVGPGKETGVVISSSDDQSGNLDIKEPQKKVFDPATFILKKELDLKQRDITDTSTPDIVREKGRIAEEEKRKPGRPKGSKNKKIDPNAPPPVPKKRGRPRKPAFLSNDVELENNAAIQ